MNKKQFYTFIGLFYLLNVLDTYLVTTHLFNPYLIPFKREFILELNALLGNISALSLLLGLGFLIIKKPKYRMTYLLTLTLILNIGLFSIGIFTKYYQTMFSIFELTLFNNPAPALAGSILLEALKELFTHLRITVFIPFIVLMVVFFLDKKQNRTFYYPYSKIFMLLLSMVSILTSFITLGVTKVSMERVWPISAERTLYGVQNAGLYNYYIGQFLGINLSVIEADMPDLSVFNTYDSNQDSYTNFFGQTYSRNLTIADTDSATIDPNLLNGINVNGMFNGKNIVIIHLETFNHFLLDENGPYLDSSYFSTLKALLNESYLLDNFYTNVGIGNSSDAEFSIMTGLYPTGDTTLYWNYVDEKYVFNALPKVFDTYYSASLHGDVKEFYNRDMVHKDMFGLDDFYYFNESESYDPSLTNGYYLFPDLITKNTDESPWLSDYSLLDWTKTVADSHSPYFLFPITIQPHTPYLYDPYEPIFSETDINVDSTTLKYLNYETYYDTFFEHFIEFSKTQTNTVYLFYGDHGSGISKNDLETILGRTLTDLEYKNEMIKTLAFIYAPDDSDTNSILPRGTLTGVQPLVRSEVDFFKTILELWGLETDYQYFGANLISDEHTLSIDTRNFDIVTDDYFMIGKYMNSDKAPNETNTLFFRIGDSILVSPYDLYSDVLLFKKRMDTALRYNQYQYLKNV